MSTEINVKDEIKKKIFEGGYKSKEDKKRQDLWKEITNKQRALFDDFKSHVERYVSECKG